MKENTETWPIRITLPVLWGDMDAFEHVNNTRYFRWFESARIEYFRALNFSLQMSQEGLSLILAQTSCEYLLPLTYPDEIVAKASVCKIGTTSILQNYLIHSLHHKDKPVAKGQGVIVLYDFKKKTKVNITQELIDAIHVLEQKTL